MPTTLPLHHQRRFTLGAPIDNVPAGATGQLKRLDSYHLALLFDHYEDLVCDIADTEPTVLKAIQLHTVNPSMTDPPRCRWQLAAAVAIACVLGFNTE